MLSMLTYGIVGDKSVPKQGSQSRSEDLQWSDGPTTHVLCRFVAVLVQHGFTLEDNEVEQVSLLFSFPFVP